jgi:hypothetical protein
VLLIDWDAADWEHITHLLEKGLILSIMMAGHSNLLLWSSLFPSQLKRSCMKRPNRKRQIGSISTSRWTTYAAAGAATALTCANSAEAEIHYSGEVHIKVGSNSQASLPLSNGASLLFENFYAGSYYLQAAIFLMKGVVSGSARGYFMGATGRDLLSNLRRRENVSAGPFVSVTSNPGRGVLFSFESGAFKPDAMGFVGFRFNINGNGTQYGWARIETRRGLQGRLQYVVEDYAWGDVGDTILAGQKESIQAANVSSTSGSLALLALGSQGLEAWRAMRTQNSD